MPIDIWTRLKPWRAIRCPFCFERFRAYEMHMRCQSSICRADYSRGIPDPILDRATQGARAGKSARGSTIPRPWWTDPRRDKSRGIFRFLDYFILPRSVICAKCERQVDTRLCPRCHAILPESVVKLAAGHVAILGPQSVGKTTFITVLIHECDHKIGPEHGFVLDPLTDEIRERYESHYHSFTYGGVSGGGGEPSGYAAAPRRISHMGTPGVDTNPEILKPLVFRLMRRGEGRITGTLLSFFDSAGEDWEMNVDRLRSEALYIKHARGILFLLDPLRIRAVMSDPRIRLTEKERHVASADYLDDARKLATFFPDQTDKPTRTPLAICLNKLDRWGKLMEPGSAIHTWACSVPSRPADRELDATIDREVRKSLERWGAAGFLEYVAVKFPNHRFFVCSALGDAAQERDDAPQPLPTPLLVDRPLLWLLQRQGVLRD